VTIFGRFVHNVFSTPATRYRRRMPRGFRIQVPGIYHVTTQGLSSRGLFVTADARRLFLRLLAGVTARYSLRIHAYCVMTTHYHLLLTTTEGDLARSMQWLNGVYGSLLNAIEHDRGHVFGGRYSSTPVLSDAHFNEVVRYIALNPVRAGIGSDPADWPWGSYRLLVRGLRLPAWLDAERVLSAFGRDADVALRRLEAFVRDGMGMDIAA
jgi:putative transposase